MTKEKRQGNFFELCILCKGSCCREARPPLTLQRRRIIEQFLKEQKISVENPLFEDSAYSFPRENNERYCLFYDRITGKCKIHPVKPETCVAGPITFDINKQSGKIEWHLKKETICPLAGKLFKNREMFEKHFESARKEILHLIGELDSRALKAILKIEEPETFKISEETLKVDILNKLKD